MQRLPRRIGLALLLIGVGAAIAALVVFFSPRTSIATTDGEGLFRQRCAVCHPTGDRGAQGPGLARIVGRSAASGQGFSYSRALRSSKLVWDQATLDQFLAAPSALVPGTTMRIAVSDPTERRALVAYLGTLEDGEDASLSASASPAGDDYHADAPGKRRRVLLRDLPPPYATPSVRNAPSIVDPPVGARPSAPAGFVAERFAVDLDSPRQIKLAPNGDIFIAESAAGRIRVLRAKDGSSLPDRIEFFATGLSRPFGLAFFPPGPDPRWLYVANTDSVVRFPYLDGDLRARGAAEVVIPMLPTGGHWTRDLALSPDGASLFVSVGSGSNVAEEMPHRAAAAAEADEALRGLGAAWDEEEDRATVLRFELQGPDDGGTPTLGRRTHFANGLRNCVGMAIQPKSGDLWCSTNERDGLGDDLVPDYVTRVREGAFYGWPWYYLGGNEDPRRKGERPDLAAKVTVPDVLLPAHSASLGIVFYDGATFPAEYRGDLFAAFHGSWNRASRRGPKVVRVLFRDGAPTGEVEDFLTGFVVDDEHVWGRPVGVAVAHDGALLVTEDANGTVWRVAYRGE